MAGWPEGIDRVILTTTDSTSAEAARRAPRIPTWIMAREQTAARGRRGRAWSMPPGNFAASLIWHPGGPADTLALRSFVASLALHDALTALEVRGLSLKWPNDVLLNGGKLAGILLESPGNGGLVLGIGVNLAAAPAPDSVEPGATRPVSVLGESGLRIAPETLLDELATAFARREAQFTTWGFAPIRTDWLARAARLGEPITARLMTETLLGTFETIDDAGHLILRTPSARHEITAGDVFFGEAPCS